MSPLYRSTYDSIVNYNICPECQKRFKSTKIGVKAINNKSGLHIVFKCCSKTWYFWPANIRLFLDSNGKLIEVSNNVR